MSELFRLSELIAQLDSTQQVGYYRRLIHATRESLVMSTPILGHLELARKGRPFKAPDRAVLPSPEFEAWHQATLEYLNLSPQQRRAQAQRPRLEDLTPERLIELAHAEHQQAQARRKKASRRKAT